MPAERGSGIVSAPALDTPEQMAARLYMFGSDATKVMSARSIRARDEQVAAKCEQLAADAQREADAHDAQATEALKMAGNERADDAAGAHIDRARYCEGQASAFRALASMLRGAR